MGQIVSDDFNRADGAIGSNWTNIGTGNEVFVVATNRAQPNGSSIGEVLAYYSGASWAGGGGGANQYAEVKATGLESGKDTAIAARVSGASIAAANAYLFVINSDDVATGFGAMKVALYKQVAGSFTALTADTAATVAANDVIRIEVSGSSPNIAIVGKINGTTVLSVSGETSLASGNPGLYIGSGRTSHFDDFAAGDLASSSSPFFGTTSTLVTSAKGTPRFVAQGLLQTTLAPTVAAPFLGRGFPPLLQAPRIQLGSASGNALAGLFSQTTTAPFTGLGFSRVLRAPQLLTLGHISYFVIDDTSPFVQGVWGVALAPRRNVLWSAPMNLLTSTLAGTGGGVTLRGLKVVQGQVIPTDS